MKALIAAAMSAAIAMPVLADDEVKVDPDRRALLVKIIEDLGCEMNGATPTKEFLGKMEEHKFVKEETKAIARQLFDEGVAKREGAMLILTTETCS